MKEKGAVTAADGRSEGSLVPLIEDEERQLAEMVESARGIAEETVRQAQAAAAARIEEKKRAIPLSLHDRKARELAALAQEVEALDHEASARAAQMAMAVSESQDAAIARIVNIVIA